MVASSSWRRTLGNVRSFVGNSLGGLRGGSNLASWAVAGTLAYFLWVKPSRDLKKQQEERAALAAASDRYAYVEKRKPIPDPQVVAAMEAEKVLCFPPHLSRSRIGLEDICGYLLPEIH